MESLLLILSLTVNVYLIRVLYKLSTHIDANTFWGCFTKSVSNEPVMAHLDRNDAFLEELARIVTNYSVLSPLDTSYCETLQDYLKLEVEFAGTTHNLAIFKESLRKKCAEFVFSTIGFNTPCFVYHTQLTDDIYKVSVCYAVNTTQAQKLVMQNNREREVRRRKIAPPVLRDDSLEKELNELNS